MDGLTDWAYKTTLGEDYDPIRQRYGLSRQNVQQAIQTKELDLNVRNQEASILGQQLANARVLAEEFYKQRQRMETDAQLTDAYNELQSARDSVSLADIYRKYPAVQRDEAFKAAYEERKALYGAAASAAVDAAKLGVLGDYNQKMAAPQPPDPKMALAEAVDTSISDTTKGQLQARGLEVPTLADGTIDRAGMNVMRAQLEAEDLAPEERQFVLDKWRMLSKKVNEPASYDPDEVDSAKVEILQLEQLLDPRKRKQRNSTAPSGPSTIPNDDYFQP